MRVSCHGCVMLLKVQWAAAESCRAATGKAAVRAAVAKPAAQLGREQPGGKSPGPSCRLLRPRRTSSRRPSTRPAWT